MRVVQHPGICRLYDWFEDRRYIYMVMQTVNGVDLFEAIMKHYNGRQACWDEQEVKRVFFQIADALQSLHSKGIAHRDLKPENILLTEELDIMIIDFGTAKMTGDSSSTVGLGTKMWSPPEQITQSGRRYSACAADMFSLGAILFTLLSGALFFPSWDDYWAVHVRFDRQPSESHWNRISAEAKDLIRRCVRDCVHRSTSLPVANSPCHFRLISQLA
jgi:serine/threonine protein kinase